MFFKLFFFTVFDTVKNISIKTLTFEFKRKGFLLSEKNKKSKSIGYARATDSEFDHLDEQIKSLKNEGCSLIFSEIVSLDEEIKPELKKALNYLSKGDELVVTKLDRAFANRNECIKTIHKLLNNDVKLRTLSGFLSPKNSSVPSVATAVGPIEFTRIQSRPSTRASARVKPITAALEVE